MKANGRRVGLIFLGLVCLGVATLALITWRAVRQDRLNSLLISAIKRRDDPTVLLALKQGADPCSHAYPKDHRPVWQEWLDLLRGRKVSSARAPSALLLLMDPGKFDPAIWGSLHDYLRVYNPNAALVRAMLGGGANPNERNLDGLTPLMFAVVDDRPDLIRLLTSYGADPDATGPPFLMHKEFEEHDMWVELDRTMIASFSEYVYRVGPDLSLLICAVDCAKPQTLQALLEAGAHVNARDAFGETALLKAVTLGIVEKVKLLLRFHADWRVKYENGDTPVRRSKNLLKTLNDEQYRTIQHLLLQAGATE